MLFLDYAGEPLHDPRSDEQCINATVSVEVNAAGSASFSVADNHPLYGSFAGMSPDQEVALRDGDIELFRGRIKSDANQLLPQPSYECQGCLGYLNDSLLRPYATYENADGLPVVPSSADKLFEWMVNQSNSQLGLNKSFTVGRNEGGKFGSVVRSSTQYPTVGAEILDKLIASLGGYLFASFDKGTRFIEWLADGQGDCTQQIEFGTNLLDFSSVRDASGVITCIIPTAENLDISDYPDGAIGNCHKVGDRILFPAGVSLYGIIEEQRSYDVTTLEGLAQACANDLETASIVIDSVEITAADLSLIDSTIRPFRLGQWIRVICDPLGIDEKMMCVKIVYDVVNPANTKYTLGSTRKSFVGSQAKQNRATGAQLSELVTQVPAISQEAKDAASAAESKARTFTNQPVPPYSVGDIWMQDGKTYVCTTAKEA